MDMHTPHLEHAVLLGLFAILTVANSVLHRGMKDVRWFLLYTSCAFLGRFWLRFAGWFQRGRRWLGVACSCRWPMCFCSTG